MVPRGLVQINCLDHPDAPVAGEKQVVHRPLSAGPIVVDAHIGVDLVLAAGRDDVHIEELKARPFGFLDGETDNNHCINFSAGRELLEECRRSCRGCPRSTVKRRFRRPETRFQCPQPSHRKTSGKGAAQQRPPCPVCPWPGALLRGTPRRSTGRRRSGPAAGSGQKLPCRY